MRGVIKRSTGSWYDILTEDFRIIPGKIKGKFRLSEVKTTNPVAVGDFIEYNLESSYGTAVINKLVPRKNYIIRRANNLSRQSHIIAANLDQVLIIATIAWPRTSQGFIDRLLLTAEAYHIPAIIAFKKVDIYDEEMQEVITGMRNMYENIGYKCFTVSGKTGYNIDILKEELKGKTTLVTGHSGVGKSQLLNSLHPDLSLKTGEISGYSLKGKHTTTFAEMHIIDKETFVIDTPGIKDFGIVDIPREEISHYFPEMRELLSECRFRNCMHINEPGCAVLEAVEEGIIHPARYYSYLSILDNEDTHH